MYKLYILGALILVYILYINNDIESFSLNFPENDLKCKCGMGDDISDQTNEVPVDNNVIEQFTNYDKSKLQEKKKLDRIYNIHKSPYDETAEEYYNKQFGYPIKPLNSKFKYSGSNDIKYKNIGSSNNKILGKSYEDLSFSTYNFGLI
jgi:hypothetical protein